jgi:hypothetical protein
MLNYQIRGNIDFNKISSNKKIKSYFEEVSNKFKNPPIGFYQPKYDSILNKTRDIYFYKKQLPSPRQKKIKQIIYSYNVHYNYEIAPSLNDHSQNNVEDVYNLKSEIGILYLSDFNRKAITSILKSKDLEFHPLIDCKAFVYIWKGHPLAQKKISPFHS